MSQVHPQEAAVPQRPSPFPVYCADVPGGVARILPGLLHRIHVPVRRVEHRKTGWSLLVEVEFVKF